MWPQIDSNELKKPYAVPWLGKSLMHVTYTKRTVEKIHRHSAYACSTQVGFSQIVDSVQTATYFVISTLSLMFLCTRTCICAPCLYSPNNFFFIFLKPIYIALNLHVVEF